MMDTFLSRHGEDEVNAKLDLTERRASRHGLKALETSASRRDLLEEDEKVLRPSAQISLKQYLDVSIFRLALH